MKPTIRCPFMTGRHSMTLFAMMRAASSTVVSSSTLMMVLTIIISTMILASRVGISHTLSEVTEVAEAWSMKISGPELTLHGRVITGQRP
jgi:hypothetical protein